MSRLLFLVIALVALLGAAPAGADNSVHLSRTTSLIGEQLGVTIKVVVPAGATVELTPGTPSWSGVDIVTVKSVSSSPQADGVLWVIEAVVAPFIPGDISFGPTVSVVQGPDATSLTLPPVAVRVRSTLAAGDPLELSPLPAPAAIEGAESQFLKPALVGGGLLTAVILIAASWLLGRLIRRRLRRPPVSVPAEAPRTLEGAEQLIDADPVAAYRLMSIVVKTELARRHGLRATALTTSELRARLESGGDRWQARLVSGLLEECDSVIYAGYRPAAERRQADLTMAREIVEVGA